MQSTLDVSSDSASSGKGIDADVGRAEADKERVVCEMGKEVHLTFERKSVGGEPQYSDKYLEWISSQKWKSYDMYDSRGRQVRVKIHPTHTWVKRTQWNAHCRKTTYLRKRSGQWTVCEDMASLTEWQTLDPSRVERIVTVMVPTEWYVNGEAYYAMTALSSVKTENFGILTRKERSDTTRPYGRAFAGDARHCHLVAVVLFSSMFF